MPLLRQSDMSTHAAAGAYITVGQKETPEVNEVFAQRESK